MNFHEYPVFCRERNLLYRAMRERKEVVNIGRFRFLFHWRQQMIDWPMMQAAIDHWCIAAHVFRFGLDEICPTFEEFSRILGLDPWARLALPSRVSSARDVLRGWLGIPRVVAKEAVLDRILNLHLLVRFFLARIDEESSWEGIRRLVLLLLFIDVLLVHPSPMVDIGVLGMVVEAQEGRNPAPVILGETLHWLDAARVDRAVPLSGSPLLVLIWLQERFQMVARPQHSTRLPQSFFHRTKLRSYGGDYRDVYQAWRGWFARQAIYQIRWVIEWWGITEFVAHAFRLPDVRVPALRVSSYYFPSRVMRQFGRDQVLFRYPAPFEHSMDLTNVAQMAALASLWESCRIMTTFAVPTFKVTPVPPDALMELWIESMMDPVGDPCLQEWQMGETCLESGIQLYRIYESQRNRARLEEGPWVEPLARPAGIEGYLGV